MSIAEQARRLAEERQMSVREIADIIYEGNASEGQRNYIYEVLHTSRKGQTPQDQKVAKAPPPLVQSRATRRTLTVLGYGWNRRADE